MKRGFPFRGASEGSPFAVYVPLNAVVAIYARETGAGTVLGPEPEEGEEILRRSPGRRSRRKTSHRPKAAESRR